MSIRLLGALSRARVCKNAIRPVTNICLWIDWDEDLDRGVSKLHVNLKPSHKSSRPFKKRASNSNDLRHINVASDRFPNTQVAHKTLTQSAPFNTLLQTHEGSERMLNAPLPRVDSYRYRREKKSKKTATHRRDVTLLSVAFGITSTARQSPSLRSQSCLSLAAPISHELSGRPYIQKGRWISPAAFPGPCEAGNLHVSLCMSINVFTCCPQRPGNHPGRVGTVSLRP